MSYSPTSNNSEKIFKYAYTGSFDPWTKGHQSVIESFLKKDSDANIEIIIGVNTRKKPLLSATDRAFIIKQGISKEFLPRIKVTIVENVIADYMYEQNIPYFIRGIRDEKDYREEVTLANINSQLFGTPMTLLIPQIEPSLSDVSSSNLKLLGNLGIPIDRYANAYTRELMKMKTTGKLLIGVTGGIASGKSTFCKALSNYSINRELNIQTINMDEFGHIVLETDKPIPLFVKARNQIAKTFGDDILDDNGSINRHKLGEKVFGNTQKLNTLTNLLSEPILYLLAKEIRSAQNGIVLIESAILMERNITELIDENLIHVFTNTETQIKRMKISRKLSQFQAEKRINSQLSSKEIKNKILSLQDNNFDRLYYPVETSRKMTEDQIAKIYNNLSYEYHKRKEARRTVKLFIPEDIVVKDEVKYFAALSDYYGNPDRGYHNLDHIAEMLNMFQKYKNKFSNPMEVYFAIILHDAIYNVAYKDNEYQSAVLAEKFIRDHVENNEINITKVKKYIELTALHAEEIEDINDETKLFLDMDMAILAAPLKRLLEYEKGIYQEYSSLYSTKDYRAGREYFLKSIQDKKSPIFLSKLFQEKYEHLAQKNIQYLLNQLNEGKDLYV